MYSLSNSDSTVIGLIEHLNILNERTKDLCGYVSNIAVNNPNTYCSTSHDAIDKVECICGCIKRIEQLLMVIRNELQLFEKIYITVVRTVVTKRGELLSEIQKRREMKVQPNITDNLYSESEHIMHFDTKPCDDNGCSIDKCVMMKELMEPKDYSILALISRFESEQILQTIEEATRYECVKMKRMYDRTLNNVSVIKNMCNDPEFYMHICDGDDDSNKQISTLEEICINCDAFASYTKHAVTKIFQIYQELLHNYDMYSKAVQSYTSFAVECFFNPYSDYEF